MCVGVLNFARMEGVHDVLEAPVIAAQPNAEAVAQGPSQEVKEDRGNPEPLVVGEGERRGVQREMTEQPIQNEMRHLSLLSRRKN